LQVLSDQTTPKPAPKPKPRSTGTGSTKNQEIISGQCIQGEKIKVNSIRHKTINDEMISSNLNVNDASNSIASRNSSSSCGGTQSVNTANNNKYYSTQMSNSAQVRVVKKRVDQGEREQVKRTDVNWVRRDSSEEVSEPIYV